MHGGSLALIEKSRSRTDRELDEEIRMLQLERRELQRERNIGLSDLREPTARGSIGIEKNGVEELQVRIVKGLSRSPASTAPC